MDDRCCIRARPPFCNSPVLLLTPARAGDDLNAGRADIARKSLLVIANETPVTRMTNTRRQLSESRIWHESAGRSVHIYARWLRAVLPLPTPLVSSGHPHHESKRATDKSLIKARLGSQFVLLRTWTGANPRARAETKWEVVVGLPSACVRRVRHGMPKMALHRMVDP
jgi:hypothetical protein